MKISRLSLFAFALPLIAGVSFFAPRTFAAQNCAITSGDLDAIAAAQNQGIAGELAARKELLSRVIACAKDDAIALQKTLNSTDVAPADKALRAQLSGKLDEAAGYYDFELGKVGDAGISGTQGIAKEVFAWRQSNYGVLAGQVQNFILWEQNQPLFQVANDRLNQMRNIVGVLEQAGQNGDLQAALSAAEPLVRTANDENAGARDALVRMLPPDQSLALIKHSLQSLSDAYTQFFNVSTIVQKLLATKPQ